jgi:hypothetical protein
MNCVFTATDVPSEARTQDYSFIEYDLPHDYQADTAGRLRGG